MVEKLVIAVMFTECICVLKPSCKIGQRIQNKSLAMTQVLVIKKPPVKILPCHSSVYLNDCGHFFGKKGKTKTNNIHLKYFVVA